MSKLSVLARVTIALALLAATPSARAEQACADHAAVVKKLAERFGETLKSLGLHRNDAVVEIYSSETTGTWTILMTRPDGISCLLAAGQLWEQDVQPLTKPGSDA